MTSRFQAAVERASISPIRVGVDDATGLILTGYDHEVQSVTTMFATRYHERVTERWLGSFVPHVLGDRATERVLTRFFWAIASAIDLWEPNWRVSRVLPTDREGRVISVSQAALDIAVDDLRQGAAAFRVEHLRFPRGFLGDFTPEGKRSFGLVGAGGGRWERYT